MRAPRAHGPRPPVLPLVALLAIPTLAGCGDPSAETGDPDPPCTATGAPIETDPVAGLVTVRCERAADVRIRYLDGSGADREVEGPSALLGEAEIPIFGLSPDSTHEIAVLADDGDGAVEVASLEIRTGVMPEEWTGCTATGADGAGSSETADNVVCFNVVPDSGTPGVACFDRSGAIVRALVWPEIEVPLLLRILSDGAWALTSASDDGVTLFDRLGRPQGVVRSFDLKGTRYDHHFLDGHDLREITEGAWAGALALHTVSTEILADGLTYTGSGVVILDRESGEVLWDWHILGEPGDGAAIDPSLECPEGSACLHANAFLHGIDDRGEFLLLGLNALDQILRIDVATGHVVDRIGLGGDYRLVDDLDAASPHDLPESEWFYNPHAPSLVASSGTRTRLMVYDNGQDREGSDLDPFSRVVEYELDSSSGLATIRFQWGDMDPGSPDHWYSGTGGDVDPTTGDALVFLNGAFDIFVSEIAYPEGGERWRLSCDGWSGAYRMSWFPSPYDTTWEYAVAQ